MPGSRGGKMASRGRRGRKRKITKDIVAPGSHCLNFVSNNYVYNGKLVTCDRCAKWRLLEEYQQACLPRYMHFDCSMWNISEEDKGSCDIPQVQDDSILINELYTPGSIVSAKMRGHPWWPAMIEAHDFQVFYHKKPLTELKYHVVFFGERVTRSWIAEKHLEPFCESSFRSVATKQDMKIAIRDAVRAQKMTREDRLDTFGFGKRYNVIKLPENGTKNTNKRPSCPTEDSTIGDMAERAECSRPSGIVEEEPARKRYRKNLAKEAGVVPPSKLQLKKAELKNKVKEVKKGSQGRLTRFRKKECLSENKEIETQNGEAELPEHCSGSAALDGEDEHGNGSLLIKENKSTRYKWKSDLAQKFQRHGNFEDELDETAPEKDLSPACTKRAAKNVTSDIQTYKKLLDEFNIKSCSVQIHDIRYLSKFYCSGIASDIQNDDNEHEDNKQNSSGQIPNLKDLSQVNLGGITADTQNDNEHLDEDNMGNDSDHISGNGDLSQFDCSKITTDTQNDNEHLDEDNMENDSDLRSPLPDISQFECSKITSGIQSDNGHLDEDIENAPDQIPDIRDRSQSDCSGITSDIPDNNEQLDEDNNLSMSDLDNVSQVNDSGATSDIQNETLCLTYKQYSDISMKAYARSERWSALEKELGLSLTTSGSEDKLRFVHTRYPDIHFSSITHNLTRLPITS